MAKLTLNQTKSSSFRLVIIIMCFYLYFLLYLLTIRVVYYGRVARLS